MAADDRTRTGDGPSLDQKALDHNALAALSELVGGDHEVLTEIIDAFLEEAPERLGELRRGQAAGDAVLVEMAAHTLKANAATFGVTELARLCLELEIAGRAQDLHAAGPLVEAAEREWATVRAQLVSLREHGLE
jgi:histidine phosphotransfer protein HptB